MTVKQALTIANSFLTRSETPQLDREILLSFSLGCERIDLYTHPERELNIDQQQKYLSYLKRRQNNEPIAYITGEKEFMGLSFIVDENVLIPRPDTETVVESALKILQDRFGSKELDILDLCCGSGAIGISIKSLWEKVNLTLSDISPGALEITRKNLETHQLTARTVESNLFEKLTGKFDLIISNPPYIKRDDLNCLSRDIINFEPRIALDGGIEGYDFYKRISSEAARFLKPEGLLICEIGFDQGQVVRQLFLDNGFKRVLLGQDLSGCDRFAVVFN